MSWLSALLPFSFKSSVGDVEAAVKAIADKAEADIAAIRASSVAAQAKTRLVAASASIQSQLQADLAVLSRAAAALVAKANADTKALSQPVPPPNPLSAPSATGPSGPALGPTGSA